MHEGISEAGAAASFTDYLDGHIARRDGLVTNFGKLMYLNEEFKTLPLGDIWNEYLARQGMNNDWYAEVEKYERDVLIKRA